MQRLFFRCTEGQWSWWACANLTSAHFESLDWMTFPASWLCLASKQLQNGKLQQCQQYQKLICSLIFQWDKGTNGILPLLNLGRRRRRRRKRKGTDCIATSEPPPHHQCINKMPLLNRSRRLITVCLKIISVFLFCLIDKNELRQITAFKSQINVRRRLFICLSWICCGNGRVSGSLGKLLR